MGWGGPGHGALPADDQRTTHSDYDTRVRRQLEGVLSERRAASPSGPGNECAPGEWCTMMENWVADSKRGPLRHTPEGRATTLKQREK